MMKKTYKKTAVVLVALGLALFTAACTANSNSQNNASPYEKKSYSVDAEKVAQISLTDRERTVELVQSTDNQIHISYFENDKEFYEINVSGEKELIMKAVADKNWKDYVGLDLDKESRTIQISVPSGISSGIAIQTTNGDVVLSELNISGAVDASTTDGIIKFTNVAVNGTLKVNNKNDDIILSDVRVKGAVDASINNGNIEVTKLAVDDTLKLQSKNGHITGTIVGSYDAFNITSKASKGNNNLPENKSGGAKKLDVNTNNGDINLEFVE